MPLYAIALPPRRYYPQRTYWQLPGTVTTRDITVMSATVNLAVNATLKDIDRGAVSHDDGDNMDGLGMMSKVNVGNGDEVDSEDEDATKETSQMTTVRKKKVISLQQ